MRIVNVWWVAIAVISLVVIAPVAFGQPDREARWSPQKVFDNGNIFACEMTDMAEFTLDRPVRVNRIEVWYHWRNREGSVGYTLSKNGQILHSGFLARGDCDPYQEKWCNAVKGFDLWLRPGTYLIRTERPHICQNRGSEGNGFVKVYGWPR